MREVVWNRERGERTSHDPAVIKVGYKPGQQGLLDALISYGSTHVGAVRSGPY